MRLSTRSWPYRLYVWWWESPPKDLCRLFWGCLAAALMAPFWLLGKLFDKLPLLAKKILAVTVPVVIIGYLLVLFVLAIADNLWNLLFIPLGIVGIAAVLLGIFFALDWIANRQRAGSSSLGVVVGYIGARKRKVCPLIEVVDE